MRMFNGLSSHDTQMSVPLLLITQKIEPTDAHVLVKSLKGADVEAAKTE
jgi:hypothetical protein